MEAQHINRSLSALGDVIAALAAGSSHVRGGGGGSGSGLLPLRALVQRRRSATRGPRGEKRSLLATCAPQACRRAVAKRLRCLSPPHPRPAARCRTATAS